MIDSLAKDLTPGEERSLEKVALYRATVGRQAGRIRQLEAGLRDLREYTAPGSPAHEAIDMLLAEWPEGA